MYLGWTEQTSDNGSPPYFHLRGFDGTNWSTERIDSAVSHEMQLGFDRASNLLYHVYNNAANTQIFYERGPFNPNVTSIAWESPERFVNSGGALAALSASGGVVLLLELAFSAK